MSLIEVLVALAVVAIALFAIAATQTSAFAANIQAREIAMVRDIASQAVADIRSAAIQHAYEAPGNWADMLEPSGCATPMPGSLAIMDLTGAGPATSADVPSPSCGGGYTVVGQDGVAYEVRWQLGVAGEAANILPTINSPQLGLVHVLLRIDWERGGSRSMSFEDYVGCADVDADVCPAGPEEG